MQGLFALIALMIVTSPLQADDSQDVETADGPKATVAEDPADELPMDPDAQPVPSTEVQRQPATTAAPVTTLPPPPPTSPPPPPPTTLPAPPPPTAAPAPRPTQPPPTTPPAPPAPPTGASGNCDPSYPDVCIPPAPPDLDCGDVSYRRFRVLQPDPHGFDGNDNDGLGCES